MAMKRCPVCGEKYSETYRDCPFCEEEEAMREGEEIRRKPRGKRVARGRRFSLITPTLIILILIMSGVLIHLLYGGDPSDRIEQGDTVDTSPVEDVQKPDEPNDTQEPDDTQAPPDTQEPVDTQEPDDSVTMPEDSGTSTDTPDTPVKADKPEEQKPSESKNAYEEAMELPSGLTLSKTDFTLGYAGEAATIRVSGGDGSYTWISQDDGVASVDENGKVVGISRGTINVIATDGEKKGVCIVRCNFSGTASSGTTSPGATSSGGTSSGTASSGESGLKAGSAKVVNGGNGVRVRSGPGTSYDILATVPNGASIRIVESAGDGWYKITFTGMGGVTTPGYMKGEFLANN